MYAVIATGGKQYRVSEGTVVRVEKLDVDAGATVEFNQVRLIGGQPATTRTIICIHTQIIERSSTRPPLVEATVVAACRAWAITPDHPPAA